MMRAGAIGYITPADKLAGKSPEILENREQKLAENVLDVRKMSSYNRCICPSGTGNHGCFLNVNRKTPVQAEPGHSVSLFGVCYPGTLARSVEKK
jgi:hypothetical protein